MRSILASSCSMPSITRGRSCNTSRPGAVGYLVLVSCQPLTKASPMSHRTWILEGRDHVLLQYQPAELHLWNGWYLLWGSSLLDRIRYPSSWVGLAGNRSCGCPFACPRADGPVYIGTYLCLFGKQIDMGLDLYRISARTFCVADTLPACYKPSGLH